MRKYLIISLVLYCGHSSLYSYNKELCKHVGTLLVSSTALYTAGIWFAKETLRDIDYRFIELKRIYNERQQELAQFNELTPEEISFLSKTQALVAFPEVYWREIASTGISFLLFYYATLCAQRALGDSQKII